MNKEGKEWKGGVNLTVGQAVLIKWLQPDTSSLKSLMILKSLRTELVRLFGAETAKNTQFAYHFSNRGSDHTSLASRHPFHNSKCAPSPRALRAMPAVSQEPDNTSLKSLMTLKSLRTWRVKLFGAELTNFTICLSFSNRGSNLIIIHKR